MSETVPNPAAASRPAPHDGAPAARPAGGAGFGAGTGLEVGIAAAEGLPAGTWPSLETLERMVEYRRNPLARRYRLYVDREGQPRVTLPPRGTLREARQLVRRHADWLIRQLDRVRDRAEQRRLWLPGRLIYFRGEPGPLQLQSGPDGWFIALGTLRIPWPKGVAPGQAPGQAPGLASSAGVEGANLRPVVEAWLRGLATRELPVRGRELAAPLGLRAHRFSVRNQRSRWGSCSTRGTVSLNWRLVQVPEPVRDYIILHELMHLREMNHSPRYWAHVAAVCPDYARHEAWLRAHERRILG